MAVPIGSEPNSTGSVELVLRYQAGDQIALDRLWTRYLPRLKRWARGRLPGASRDATSTDDLVQETFVRCLGQLRTMKPRGPHSLFAYFRTTILNQVRDFARQEGRRPRREIVDADERWTQDPSPLEQVVGRELFDRYDRALSTLNEAEQELVIAYVELRCSDRELAELFEKPTSSAARMARVRALARLVTAMGKE